MAGTIIMTSGPIINEHTNGTSDNPWELHEFNFQVVFEETAEFDSHISWELIGDKIPTGITIDDSGIIKGIIPILNNETYVTDKYPKEKIDISGNNWTNIGRPKSATYVCPFIAKRTYMVIDPALPAIPPKEETAETTVEITIIKNNDLDTLVYLLKYLKDKESVIVVKGEEVLKQHYFEHQGVKYNWDNIYDYFELLGYSKELAVIAKELI